jgi:hypothetical protein
MLSFATRVSTALLGALLLSFGLTASADAQDRGSMLPRVSPNASVSQTVGVTTVEITYGRPATRDRTIFGEFVSYGDVWRTGANEATVIDVSTPVSISGEMLAAGRYSLFTIPGEDEWTIIFNETADQWGAYNYDESKDALRVTTESMSGPDHEMLTFAFESVTDTSATLLIQWADTHVPIEMTVDTPAIISERGDEMAASADNWQVPLRFAGYALQSNMMLDKAMSWANASLEMQETFPGLSVMARIHAAQGNYDEAVTAGEKAMEMANAMEEMPRGADDLQASLDEWRSK